MRTKEKLIEVSEKIAKLVANEDKLKEVVAVRTYDIASIFIDLRRIIDTGWTEDGIEIDTDDRKKLHPELVFDACMNKSSIIAFTTLEDYVQQRIKECPKKIDIRDLKESEGDTFPEFIKQMKELGLVESDCKLNFVYTKEFKNK